MRARLSSPRLARRSRPHGVGAARSRVDLLKFVPTERQIARPTTVPLHDIFVPTHQADKLRRIRPPDLAHAAPSLSVNVALMLLPCSPATLSRDLLHLCHRAP